MRKARNGHTPSETIDTKPDETVAEDEIPNPFADVMDVMGLRRFGDGDEPFERYEVVDGNGATLATFALEDGETAEECRERALAWMEKQAADAQSNADEALTTASLAPETDRPDDMLPADKRFYRDLGVPLDEHRRAELCDEMAECVTKIETIKAEAKDIADGFKKRREYQEEKLAEIAGQVNSGASRRDVVCEEVIDRERGCAVTYRTDTWDEVSTRDLTHYEKQPSLPLFGEDDDTPFTAEAARKLAAGFVDVVEETDEAKAARVDAEMAGAA